MQEPQTQGITVTREQIGSYLSSLGERGRNPSTVSSYRKKLELLYAALPGGRIGRGTLRQWREQLLDQGYSPARSTPACPRPTASWSGWAAGSSS